MWTRSCSQLPIKTTVGTKEFSISSSSIAPMCPTPEIIFTFSSPHLSEFSSWITESVLRSCWEMFLITHTWNASVKKITYLSRTRMHVCIWTATFLETYLQLQFNFSLDPWSHLQRPTTHNEDLWLGWIYFQTEYLDCDTAGLFVCWGGPWSMGGWIWILVWTSNYINGSYADHRYHRGLYGRLTNWILILKYF